MKESILFQPLKIGAVELKNRFVMPAMNAHSTDHNQFLERGVAYFTERIKGGFAMVITEFMAVDPNGLGSLREAGAWDDSFIPSLQVLTQSIHEAGGVIIAQMHHAGMKSQSHDPKFVPKAPSQTFSSGGSVLEAYSLEDIENLKNSFISSAERMKRAGFDGVEIHGAHGYLLSQFQSKRWNHRIDAYGGNYENRFRLTRQIIEGVREACGKDFVIGYRVNATDGNEADDTNLKDTCVYARMAEKAGADYISVSHYDILSPYFMDPGFNADAAGEVKKHVRIPIIAVGRINDEYIAENIIFSGKADLIALGRQSICDPHFPNKVFEGKKELIFRCMGCQQRCSPDVGCEPEDIGSSCMINPFSGKELKWKIERCETPKKIAVIGAGCAGLQSAWILAARGHDVTVYEKTAQSGGHLIAASVPPKKYGFLQAVYTMEQHCRLYGVKIMYCTEITKDSLKKLDADCIIDATGSEAFRPDISGIEKYPIAEDVLSGKNYICNKKVAILGGGSVGLETAEYLLQYRNDVDVIEMKDCVGSDMVPPVRSALLKKLSEKAGIYTGALLLEADAENALYIRQNETDRKLTGYDEVVIAMGYRSRRQLDLQDFKKEHYTIGDAEQVMNAKMAIYKATKLALTI